MEQSSEAKFLGIIQNNLEVNPTLLADNSLAFEIETHLLQDRVEKMYKAGYHHLSTIIGRQHDQEIKILYPLSSTYLDRAKTVFLTITVPISSPQVPSVTKYYPGSEVYEREIAEFLGVKFNTEAPYDRLLLPDDFPDDLYPLQKKYTPKQLKEILNGAGVGNSPPFPLNQSNRNNLTSDYSISVGPQHPTHKEPIRFQFFITGENIDDVQLKLGFNHRGIEKALETGTWTQNLYLIERICGICSAAHQLAYTLSAEKIAGLSSQIPERANWIRILVAELERIHSHILWYGVLAHDAGYDMLFHVTWRDRELVMDILEKLTGNRVNYSMMAIGGVRRDIEPSIIPNLKKSLEQLKSDVITHKEIMENEKTFVARLENIGILSKEEAIKMNAVGPTARASGVDFDLRRDFSYSGYNEIPFEVYHEKAGDVYASLKVRLDETIESINMCLYILDNLPSGQVIIKVPSRIPEGEAHTRVEAPRGEDIHYIKSTGGKHPDRHKVRAPTLANITSLLHRFTKMKVADIPLIIRLIDPCIGCMERVTFVDTTSWKTKVLSGEELLKLSNRSFHKNKKIQIFR